MWEAPPLAVLEETVQNPDKTPVGMRMRAAYFLRQAYDNADRNGGGGLGLAVAREDGKNAQPGDDDDDESSAGQEVDVTGTVVRILGAGLTDRRHGSLLRHEFAYVMGQLRDERCCPALEGILSDETDCVMVRHEAGEALGAIGSTRSIPVLESIIEANPDTPEIGQTCEIALAHMRWRADGGAEAEEPMACACMLRPYSSVDPAPPHPKHAGVPTSTLGGMLLDDQLPLFERYRAMFSLRNRGGEDAVRELGKALVKDASSALLRHEVAYVLGQMQHSASVEALAESLRRTDEHAMVRHESAEALGAIEGRWDDCEKILQEFLNDGDVVVRESCAVALDAADYWGHGASTEDPAVVVVVGDESGGEEANYEDGNHEVLSFVQQKAVTNGRILEKDDKKVVGSKGQHVRGAILNHFNVAS